jgi:alcohol dehydrogenase class IV
MYPKLAVVDPELTLTMPPHLTATTGVDALTHLLETFVSSNQSNPFIDMLCRGRNETNFCIFGTGI